MALRKGIASPYGDDAADAYWTVRAIREDYDREELTIEVVVHADRRARLDGKQPISAPTFNLIGDDYAAFGALTGGMRAKAYAWLKTRPELQGTLDD